MAPLLVHLWVHHSRLRFLLHIEAAGWQRLLTLDWLQCLSSVTRAAASYIEHSSIDKDEERFFWLCKLVTARDRRRRRMVDSKWHKKQLQTRQLQNVTADWLVVQCHLTWIWSDSGSGQLPGRERHNSLSTCWTCECCQNDLNTSQIQLKLYNRKEKPLRLKYSKSSL